MLNISLPDISNSIFSTAPIDLEDIKKYFVDKTINFQLDYSKSELHTEKFLIYVSNLGIPADLILTKNLSFYQKFSLLEAYMNISSVVSLRTLNLAASSIVMRRKGYNLKDTYPNPYFTEEEADLFINDHIEMVDQWIKFLDSCTIYAQKCIPELDHEEFLTMGIPIINNKNYVGHSIIQLFSLDFFFHNYYTKPLGELAYFRPQFEDYMFQGKNLFSYFATKHNFLLPMLRTLGSSSA